MNFGNAMTPITFTLFDVLALRREFPILHQQVNGKPLAFLDSGASSQKPRRVIVCLEEYYEHTNANVHRGVYKLSEEATFAFERARGKVARFIGASSHKELIFTRNTTEAINLVARAWGDANVRAGDRILLSVMEHHSNLVPWQQLAQRTGAQLDFLPIDGEGRLVLDEPGHAADRAHQAGGDHAPIECAGHDQPGARDRRARARCRRADIGRWCAERAAYVGECAGARDRLFGLQRP